MLKSQVLLTIGAIILVVLIFFLPKSVVKDESDTLAENSSQSDTTVIPSVQDGPHNEGDAATNVSSIQANDQSLISSLRENLKNSTNNEKSTKFADSLAGVYKRLNLHDSAGWYYEAAASFSPEITYLKQAGDSYYQAFNQASSTSRANNLGEKVREMYKKVLEKDPSDADAKVKMALTYISSPQPMQGILLLREVLEKDPNNEEAIYNLGILSMQSNQYKLAVERFERLIEINPQHLQAHYFLGVSYVELKEKEKAKKQFDIVKKLDKDPEVQANVDQYLEKLN